MTASAQSEMRRGIRRDGIIIIRVLIQIASLRRRPADVCADDVCINNRYVYLTQRCNKFTFKTGLEVQFSPIIQPISNFFPPKKLDSFDSMRLADGKEVTLAVPMYCYPPPRQEEPQLRCVKSWLHVQRKDGIGSVGAARDLAAI